MGEVLNERFMRPDLHLAADEFLLLTAAIRWGYASCIVRAPLDTTGPPARALRRVAAVGEGSSSGGGGRAGAGGEGGGQGRAVGSGGALGHPSSSSGSLLAGGGSRRQLAGSCDSPAASLCVTPPLLGHASAAGPGAGAADCQQPGQATAMDDGEVCSPHKPPLAGGAVTSAPATTAGGAPGAGGAGTAAGADAGPQQQEPHQEPPAHPLAAPDTSGSWATASGSSVPPARPLAGGAQSGGGARAAARQLPFGALLDCFPMLVLFHPEHNRHPHTWSSLTQRMECDVRSGRADIAQGNLEERSVDLVGSSAGWGDSGVCVWGGGGPNWSQLMCSTSALLPAAWSCI